LAFGEQVLRITVCQYCSLKAYLDPVSWNMTACGADEEDISRIIRLADSLKTVGGKVLIHCGAGISRSAAAALILYACWLGPGREQEAMEKVFTLRPIAKPNRRMVMLADKILGREGRLIDALTWKKADFPEHMR
jgi:predicted protein tyrosine phosphatase